VRNKEGEMGPWLESLVPWGAEFIIWIQSLSTPWLDTLFEILTFLGNAEFYLILLPLVYWCIDRRMGISLGYLSLLSAWVNELVKHLFKIPRPGVLDSRVNALVEETNPSFPSGHAQGTLVNWGYLAYCLRSPVFWGVTIVVILGVGLSRIVLGVHFPQDILGGWLIGLVVLALYIWLEPPVARWLSRQQVSMQVVLAVGVPVLLIFLHPSDMDGLYPAERAITPMSALAGLGLGLVMERRWVRFRADGTWGRRGLRFLVGIVVAAVFYLGPRLLLPEEMAHGLESGVRFVRYALVGWVVAFLCPWLFVLLGLAKQEGA
jgi:membrane-associated phospholipid phosphatase